MRDAAGCRVISVIGAGGKTTLCRALARFLPGRTVYLTSTHMYPPEELPCAVLPAGTPAEAARDLIGRVPEGGGAVVSGPLENGKCTWPGRAAFEAALAAADRVIVEADGARGREIKLHGENEPVIPPVTELTAFVCSLSALGRPLGETVHRAERIGAVLGKRPEDRAEAGDLVRAALAARERSRGEFLAVLNRAPAGAGEEAARAVREAGIPCVLLPEVPCPEGARFFPADGLGRIFEAFTGGFAAGKEKA